MMITVNVNDHCNFACKYCYPQLESESAHSMTIETANEVLNYCLQNKITSIELPEKEPLFSHGIVEHIIKTFVPSGVRVSGLTTNLYNLRLSTLELLKKFDVRLLVSYDGLWQDEFRTLPHGAPTSEIVKKNLYALKGAGVRFGIACTITKGTTDRIYDNYLYLKELTPGIALNFDTTSRYQLTEDDIPTIISEFEKIAKVDTNIFPLNKIKSRIASKAHYTNFMCGAGRGSYNIDWDGSLYPCYHALAWRKIGIPIGHIRSGLDLAETAKFKTYDTSTPDKCKSCNSAICGICYTSSYDKTGNMLSPIEQNCLIFRSLTEIVRRVM